MVQICKMLLISAFLALTVMVSCGDNDLLEMLLRNPKIENVFHANNEPVSVIPNHQHFDFGNNLGILRNPEIENAFHANKEPVFVIPNHQHFDFGNNMGLVRNPQIENVFNVNKELASLTPNLQHFDFGNNIGLVRNPQFENVFRVNKEPVSVIQNHQHFDFGNNIGLVRNPQIENVFNVNKEPASLIPNLQHFDFGNNIRPWEINGESDIRRFISGIIENDFKKIFVNFCYISKDSPGLEGFCDAIESFFVFSQYNLVHLTVTNVELQISSGFMTQKYLILSEKFRQYANKVIEIVKRPLSTTQFPQNLPINFQEYSKTVFDMIRNSMDNINKKIYEGTNAFFYIQTPILVLMLVVGLVGNILLLIMFGRHAELRTSQNALIANLVVSDLLNILVNLLFNYVLNINHIEPFWNPGNGACKFITQLLYTCVGLSTWSVVALSIQRFSVVIMPLRTRTSVKCLSTKYLTLINVISVWVLSILLALPSSVSTEMDVFGYCSADISAKFLSLWNLIWYSILPPVVVAVNYILTAWRLAAETKNLPEQAEAQRRGRNRSAKVLIALTLVFIVSYLPLFLYSFLETWEMIYPALTTLDDKSESDFVSGSIFRALFFSNSALNPVALFVSSNVFRKHLKRYFPCHISRNNQNKVT